MLLPEPVQAAAPSSQPRPGHTRPMPMLSSYSQPTLADLVTFAGWLQDLVHECVVTAEAGEAHNPYATIGAAQSGTTQLRRWLASLQAEEERNLLLMDRLRAEANQECAHERLMATDADYASDFEDDDQ